MAKLFAWKYTTIQAQLYDQNQKNIIVVLDHPPPLPILSEGFYDTMGPAANFDFNFDPMLANGIKNMFPYLFRKRQNKT